MVENTFPKAADGSKTNEVFYISPIVYEGIKNNKINRMCSFLI